MQGGCRMVHGYYDSAINRSGCAVDLADTSAMNKFSHRVSTQGQDQFWLQSRNLPIQVAIASFQFGRFRVAVPWRTAFDHIGDKDLITRQT